MAGPAPSVGPIPGYEIKCKLGAGGMGVVYKAIDLKLNRTVALKFLADHEIGQPDHERLLKEARAASALDHPNIATVFSVQEAPDDRTFIVMAYYEGETLTDKIRHSLLQPAHAVNVTMQVATGLQHAHSRGIVHRDIKSSNILITNEGTAKILDFGLARIHGPAVSTETTPLGGTLYYMSPEQAEGRPLDHRTDIWSLGVVLYQMLTGRVPFLTDNAGSTLLAILNDAPALMPTVPEELQVVILRCLAKNAAGRYQNCTELIRDLEKLAFDDSQPTVTYTSRSDLHKQLKAATQRAVPRPVVRLSHRRLWFMLSLCVIVGIGLALILGPLRSRIFAPAQKHIAVLPFETGASGAATQSLADGLMESITGRLSNLDASGKSLWVVPTSQVRRRKIEDSDTARKELGATVVIQGTIAQTGENVHLKLNVIDTESQRLLGSVDVPGDARDLPAVEDTVIARLAEMMGVTAAKNARSEPVSGAAYELYLQGRGLLQRFDVADNVDGAIAKFQAAVQADPNFALAYNALAEAHWNKYRLDQNPQWLEKANEYGSRAIQLNDQLPDVYITLGNIHDATGNRNLALEEFQHALKLAPRNADALIGISRVYEHLGRDKEAEDAVKQGAALRPDYWGGWYELAQYYFHKGRYEEAASEFAHVIQLAPDSAASHANYATSLKKVGKLDEAQAEFEKSISLKPTYAAINNLGNVYYQKRRWADAAEMYQRSEQMNPNDFRPWENLGLAQQWLGEQNKARESFHQARILLEQSLKLKPDDAELQARMALMYGRDGDREKSLAHADAALAIAANDPAVLGDIAEVHELAGERERAVSDIKTALKNGWTFDELDHSYGLRQISNDPKIRAALTAR